MSDIKLTSMTAQDGWAAKLGPDALAQVLCHLPKFSDPNLLVGFSSSDDAAVYKINETTAMIQTVDIFPPVVDDPYEYGQIAAANSISDVYAMGGLPKLAMNVFCFPETLPTEVLHAILQGGYEKVQEADSLIAGGHTIKDVEPKYGLCVTGFTHPNHIWRNDTAKPGDILILTKAIGTGILTTAAKGDMLNKSENSSMIRSHWACACSFLQARVQSAPARAVNLRRQAFLLWQTGAGALEYGGAAGMFAGGRVHSRAARPQ